MDGWGIKDLHKCGEEMSKNSSISRAKNSKKTSELNGSGGGRGKGIRGAKAFCPGWRHQPGQKGGGTFVLVGGSNRDKRVRGPFVPVGATNRDKRPLSPL